MMSGYRITLQARIFILVSALVIASVSTLSFFFLKTLKDKMLSQFQAEGRYLVSNFSRDAVEPVLIEDVKSLRDVIEEVSRSKDIVYAYIYNQKGAELGTFSAIHHHKEDFNAKNITAIEFGRIQAGEDHDIPVLDASAPVLYKDEENIGYVRLGISLKGINAEIRYVVAKSILFLIGFLTACFLATFIFSRSISTPIKRMVATISDMVKSSDFTKTIHGDVSIKELDELKRSFNKMMDRMNKTTTSIVHLNYEIEERRKAELKLKELNEQLQSTVQKLEDVNQELKSFAYIASHDLKAPLRGISSLAGWISSDYGDKLGEEGKEQINLLLGRVERMQKLIDGILQYSRASQANEKKVDVDLNKLIPEIIDLIAPPENIEIAIEDKLPTVKCGETRITQVFQNLLSNAVKYMDKPQGRIEISCAENDGFWKFSIADNGPGIKKEYFEKIFQIFQTLSPHDDKDGTGIGLTAVKKIVELYGGRIWLESEPGEGSTFYFTLPKQETAVKNKELETNTVSV